MSCVVSFARRSASVIALVDEGRLLRTTRGVNCLPRLTPLASALAVLAIAGSLAGADAQAQARPFSSGWMAAKGAAQAQAAATGKLPNGMLAGVNSTARQQQQSRQHLNRSVANLGSAAAAIAARQAAQAAARAAAQNDPSVPDGLADGGLNVDTQPLTAGWLNAKAPVQTQAGGRTTVAIEQIADKAILNWETFNVGRNTTVSFQQEADWAVLNRINDPKARPSQIQGQIRGDGTVMVANRNGVVFSGSSQVNVRNLVAAAATINDEQFETRGIYSPNDTTPAFADAAGNIQVQAGAQITTATPSSVTQGGGYVLLMGNEVRNAGSITTPNGQTTLAAGDTFVIRKGQGTDGNQNASTRGNEVAPRLNVGSESGYVSNTGLIVSPTGDITLTGHNVEQAGVAVSTTTVNTRGTVHLLNSASDATGTVTLAPQSVTAVLVDEASQTALDAQRDALIANDGGLNNVQTNTGTSTGKGQTFDNLGLMEDRRDLSRVEIVSGNTVDFQGDSLTVATGGQVAVSAQQRTLLQDGAEIDVSGAVGVKVAMESNNVIINVQGNEQRDAPVNRDSTNLNNNDVWVDRRSLVYVPAGTNGYETDRWYTAGGLLEVSGYLATSGHSAAEWMAQGGTVNFNGAEVVTQAGSHVNLSGGTLDVQDGYINQTWLRGANGRLYELSRAPGDVLYDGLYLGFEDIHPRWGEKATRNFYNPILAPRRRFETGYTVGRDAGRMIVSTTSAVLEGDIVGEVFQGERQIRAPQDGLDGYNQSQTAVARRAQLTIGQYTPIYNPDSGTLAFNLAPLTNSITFGSDQETIADALGLTELMPDDREGHIFLDGDWLNTLGLGALTVAARDTVKVDAELQVSPGGTIELYGPHLEVNADLTAPSGNIRLGNVVQRYNSSTGWQSVPLTLPSGSPNTVGVAVGNGVTLDARGLWGNIQRDLSDVANIPYLNGGDITIRSTGDVELQAGSSIDVSSGAMMLMSGLVQGGRGGNVVLAADFNATNEIPALLILDGEIRGYGVAGGGSLTLESGTAIGIGGDILALNGMLMEGESAPVDLTLLADLTVRAGTPLPFDYAYTKVVALPGEALGGALNVTATTAMTLEADWTVPLSIGTLTSQRFQLRDTTGKVWVSPPPGSEPIVIPKGTVINAVAGPVDQTYVVPANVFPQGMPVAARQATALAGEAFGNDVTFTTGTVIPAGSKLLASVAVAPVLSVDPDQFRAGFSKYVVNGHQGVAVLDDAVVDVAMPIYRVSSDAGAFPSAADPRQAWEIWTPPVFQEDAAVGRFSQRAGADLVLDSLLGNISIGTGAAVSVDPGHSITLSAMKSVVVDGALSAPGGSIAASSVGLETGGTSALSPQHSVWVGEHAHLDVAGRSETALDNLERQYGTQYSGGNIVLSGDNGGFVVVQSGAILDASGTQMTIDTVQSQGLALGAGGKTAVASDGGSITLKSDAGLYLDGTMRAAAGGAGAAGGTLSLELETALYDGRASVGDERRMPSDLLVVQHAGDRLVSGGMSPYDSDNDLVYGFGRLGVDQIEAGQFSNLSLFSRDLITFDGDIDLSMSQSIRLLQGVIGNTTSGANVLLTAPYVLLSGRTNHTIAGSTAPISGTVNGWRPSKQEMAAAFQVNADHIDVRNVARFGIEGAIPLNGDSTLVDRRGYALVDLNSRGDIRFLQADSGAGSSVFPLAGYTSVSALVSPGDITLTGARVYPATGATGLVAAGLISEVAAVAGVYDETRTLRIHQRSGMSGDVAPLSVFGRIEFRAPTVEQGGTVYAPLGAIIIGDAVGSTVHLLPGSLTSVSAAGLTVPYGGTIDDLSYFYNGAEINQYGVGGMDLNGVAQGISLRGASISADSGAVLDLSGGGELLGAAFVAGRGGSTDPLFNPLVWYDDERGSFSLPSVSDHPVYAILPGYQDKYAPTAPVDEAAGYAGSKPGIGQQITISGGVPGLPAGTYTLLPAYYAMLPGAFRVEMGGGAVANSLPSAMRNGSWSTSGVASVANTNIHRALPEQIIVTSGDILRRYGEYNETSYREFLLADAVRSGRPRVMLPEDVKALELRYSPAPEDSSASALQFDGTALFNRSEGGYGGQLIVDAANASIPLEIVGAAATPDFAGVSLLASDLNAINADRISIGGWLWNDPQSSNTSTTLQFKSVSGDIYVRTGAIISAPEVVLGAASIGHIVVEQGARVDTVGMGQAPFDSSQGYRYAGGAGAIMLMVSNGWLDLPGGAGTGSGGIDIGHCPTMSCSGETSIYSEGTIAAATNNLVLGDTARFGTRNLTLAVSSLNVGSDAALVEAAERGTLPAGMRLSQDLLGRLLNGNPESGVPELERLILSVRDSVNFYGTVDLSTLDRETGESSLSQFVLNTPAIYGYGSAGDMATISTGTLVWNGLSGGAPGAVVTGGPGTGAGSLMVHADQIVFGYADDVTPTSHQYMERLAVGFSTVSLNATDRITANGEGSLSVYQAQGDYVDGAYEYTGGNLHLTTPLLTGEKASVNRITAGDALTVSAPDGAAAGTNDALGASLTLEGETVTLDSVIVLPSGKLTVSAARDVSLGSGAYLDLAGRTIELFDETRYSWGGDVTLESAHGNVVQAAGSIIDLSAQSNAAGTLSAIALGEGAGHIALAGTILGSASGDYDAGGTLVPFDAGGIVLSAQTIDDFVGLNQRLTEGEVVGRRSFRLKQGDLTIGDEIQARQVEVSVDGGSLTVNGTINASGRQVGTIRLAARDDLTLTSTAVLDAHGTDLRVDSYGSIIDAPNRAIVELTAGSDATGRLTVQGGATIDMRVGTDVDTGSGPAQYDGVARGTLDLNAPRLGANDVDIEAANAVNVRGAKTIAVNAFRRYDDAPEVTDPVDGHVYQEIRQGYLDDVHADSTAFIDAATANTGLASRLGGLGAYHLRPGVEIVSSTPDGNLVVQGDLDLSGYRYGPGVDAAVRGSGEPGVLMIRAGGDLDIYGSINDGFAPPPDTPDDATAWRLIGNVGVDNANGVDLWQQDIILPKSITLKGAATGTAGTMFPVTDGVTLNFDLPVQGATFKANARIPVDVSLNQAVTLAAGTVLGGDVRSADGTLYPKGSVLAFDLALTAGAHLGVGVSIPQQVAVQAFVIPKGTSLGLFFAPTTTTGLYLSADLSLPVGAFLPRGTKLAVDGTSVPLRDVENGQQGDMWAVAPMLPTGAQSWDLRLSGGSDLSAADRRGLQTATVLNGTGNVDLADLHYLPQLTGNAPGESPIFSVIRTGTGDLDILAGGNYRQTSLYGVYTAGTQSAPIVDAEGDPVIDVFGHDLYNLPRGYDPRTNTIVANPPTLFGPAGAAYEALATEDRYTAWYPEQGGNVVVSVQGDMTSTTRGVDFGAPRPAVPFASNYVGSWLWRQGDGTAGQPTAWWINFGTYAPWFFSTAVKGMSVEGFTGIGALGGGNVIVDIGGDAGVLAQASGNNLTLSSQALTFSVGSTGRIAPDGSLLMTGGGDLLVDIGGVMNRAAKTSRSQTGALTSVFNDLNGVLSNLRGATTVTATGIGFVSPLYGTVDTNDPRPMDPLLPSLAVPSGGPVLVAGDTALNLSARGDLVLGGIGDPGRMVLSNSLPFSSEDGWNPGGGNSWYSLWTGDTAVKLFSAGGNATPITAMHSTQTRAEVRLNDTQGGQFFYPSKFEIVAALGSIYYSPNPGANVPLVVLPALDGISTFNVLAGQSIYGGGYPIHLSGADPTTLATPNNPAFFGTWNAPTAVVVDNTAERTVGEPFTFGVNTASGDSYQDDTAPVRFYAVEGDVFGVATGAILRSSAGDQYWAGKPVWLHAGRDIVNARGLFLNNNRTDVSVVSAGRDIIHANVDIMGPGLLDVTAGRNLLQENQGRLASLGLVNGTGDPTGGAGISVTVGTGSRPVDYASFAQQYVDPENLAVSGEPLADQPGKVVKTYEKELVQWLTDRFGFEGNTEEAQAYFAELPTEQQAVFGRQVYFAELTAGGREYTDVDGPRTGSYLRGRNAIAALFPSEDAEENPIDYVGDLTMFGPSGIQTLAGGDIQILAPGGAVTFGTEGVSPPPTAGVITQGTGNIQMYALGNILLGQSRVMTTFGGDVVAWSAEGNINAGRGSKTTVVYTPLRREYDNVGNITMSPNVPATGAGFSTQAPIPEVPPGFMDLIAPEGTVDAGEAGISASGSVNIAALQVVNAANIKAQGEVTGVPLVAAVNVGALTSASAASSAAATAAQDTVQRSRAEARKNQPSIFSVHILGFGSEGVSGGGAAAAAGTSTDSTGVNGRPVSYQPDGMVQAVDESALSPNERQRFGL